MINDPIISTAKVRGIIKKNGITYVDAIASKYPKSNEGVTVWQFAGHVMVEPFGFRKPEVIAENLAKFKEALAPYGLTVKPSTQWAYEVVEA